MTTYRVRLTTTASYSVTVEADNPDDAVDLAIDGAPSGVCASCSCWSSEGWSLDLSGDWDANYYAYLDGDVQEAGQ